MNKKMKRERREREIYIYVKYKFGIFQSRVHSTLRKLSTAPDVRVQIVTPQSALSLYLHPLNSYNPFLPATAGVLLFFSLPLKFTTPAGTVVAATFREMAAFKGWSGDLRV